MTTTLISTALREHGTLTFVESDEDWSVYRTRQGQEVVLQHGTGRVLVEFYELDIPALWLEFRDQVSRFTNISTTSTQQRFKDFLAARTIEPEEVEYGVEFCVDCHRPGDSDAFSGTNGGHGSVCEDCSSNYASCERCGERFTTLTSTLHDEIGVCNWCLEEDYSFCDACDDYYLDTYSGDHHHDDDEDNDCCSSPALQFTVRNDGNEPLAQNERTTISLAAGVITQEGLASIAAYLRNYSWREYEKAIGTTEEELKAADLQRGAWLSLANHISWGELGDHWQTKKGNFTKRMSRLAHKQFGLKVPQEVMSHVGNIASVHSRGSDVRLEVSRDLNASAEDWYHDGSCWWTDYNQGRCALKTNGGFGIRTYDSNGYMSGRAWVMPLREGPGAWGNGTTLRPTFDTLTPDAFVVFNGYGDLEDYAPGRIIAHMAGMTYRKIAFSASYMYINNESAYLVAPEAIAERYTDGHIDLSLNQHSNLFETETMEVAA